MDLTVIIRVEGSWACLAAIASLCFISPGAELPQLLHTLTIFLPGPCWTPEASTHRSTSSPRFQTQPLHTTQPQYPQCWALF